MAVQERFAKAMKRVGKNTNSLGKALGVTDSAISRVLKGQTLPSSKILIPLGEKLGISIDWILFGAGDMFINPSELNAVKKEREEKKESKNSKEIENLKQKLKAKDLLIQEKTKLLEAKDKIINLLEKK